MVLNYVWEKGSISNKEAREFLNFAESTTKRVLKQMVDAKILKVEGGNRTRIYYKKMKKH